MKVLFAISLALGFWSTGCLAQVSEEDVETSFLTDFEEAIVASNESGKPLFVYVFDEY